MDPQKQRVYRWENKVVAPHDRNRIGLEMARTVVNYVWQQEGYRFPPVVTELPAHNKRLEGRANRSTIALKAGGTFTWVVLHEMAHSLMSDVDGLTAVHGPAYVGTYMALLSRYMGMDLVQLQTSAIKNHVQFRMGVQPPFLT
jgi:hypothetical protein